MKAVLAIIVCAILAPGSAHAQATVVFANDSSTRVYCSYDMQPVPRGSAFQAELMFAPDGTPFEAFDLFAVRLGDPASFNAPIDGVFLGGIRTAPITPAGGFGLFQVRVWETAYGSSYREAIASGNPAVHAGTSQILRVDTGNPNIGQTPTPLTTAGLTSFVIGPLSSFTPCIPEPSAITLSILALGFLWLLRRRRTRS